VSDLRELLHRTADIAADFLGSLDRRAVFPHVTPNEVRARLGSPLPAQPAPATSVLEELAAAADQGLVSIPSGRYFGFVIGGGLPAAVAADWLTSAWDQNAGLDARHVTVDGALRLLGLGAPIEVAADDQGRSGDANARAGAVDLALQRAAQHRLEPD
jgi:hypothetical protein